ncbi:TetR/AcrR family transcriptional regulator [Pediococcus argentinicus]|nr:TetR/AcrR family transcriptional regulator [Pediococcus argentinicus]NKZ22459.1 TetR/AcrR family transcriptional regulator [Pediococcus argentinicus]GEP20207.1 TetR family transcriptional regulator [Pediococcus argentinicus]
MTKKLDHRAQRTRKNIINSFIKLLGQKEFNKISITEITNMADVNRRTFYLHYVDIFELLDELENDLTDEFNNLVVQEVPQSLFDFHELFLSFIYGNQNLALALLSIQESKFLSKIMKIATDLNFAYSEYDTEIERKYCWNYVENGMRGMLQDWLKNQSMPLDKMVSFITGVVQRSLKSSIA